MGFNISKPSLWLSSYVKSYWTLENCLSADEEHIQRIIPNGLAELVFYLHGKPESLDSSKSISETSIITGQLKEYYDVKVRGDVSIFSITFQPNGLAKFFDIPQSEFFNQNVALKYVLKDEVDKLQTDLYEAKTFYQKVKIAEEFLLSRLTQCKEKYNYERIDSSIKRINKTMGIVKVNDLASEACYSRKQFERCFSNIVGVSPKQFLKIVRFQNALNEMSLNKNMKITELTYLCGYYDQSHITSDFHKLSGMTPRQYLKELEIYSDYFQGI